MPAPLRVRKLVSGKKLFSFCPWEWWHFGGLGIENPLRKTGSDSWLQTLQKFLRILDVSFYGNWIEKSESSFGETCFDWKLLGAATRGKQIYFWGQGTMEVSLLKCLEIVIPAFQRILKILWILERQPHENPAMNYSQFWDTQKK